MTTLESKIEAILFWKGEPMKRKKLCEILDCDIVEIDQALNQLDERLNRRGITLLAKGDEVTLGTAKELSPIIEKLTKEELTKDLGKAGSETLAIILYKGPISRRDIDWIRGVNSAFIVRNLLVRGLIEKVVSKTDERIYLYKTTFDLLSYLGLKKEADLPDFEKTKAELESIEKEDTEPKNLNLENHDAETK